MCSTNKFLSSIVLIAVLLNTCLHVNAQDRPFRSEPVSMYTFSSAPVSQANYSWESGSFGRNKGLAYMDGLTQFLDLAFVPDDRGNVFPTNFGGKSMTFELNVKWAALRQWSHVFDFGSGPYVDNVFIGNFASSSTTLRYATSWNCTTSACETSADVATVVTPNAFQHIVVTLNQILLTDATSQTAANMTLYVDGQIRGTRLAYLPNANIRQFHFLGKSNWASYGDSLFNGWIDSFYYYNYALDNQQVAAHFCTQDRPPAFEIAFSEDPRLIQGITNAQYGYADTDDATGFHNGILVLTQQNSQYIDLSTASGPNALGTTLGTIGGNGAITADMITNLGLQQGWTFEVVVKLTSSGNNAKIFDFSSSGSNSISLGFSSLTNTIVFTVTNVQTSTSLSLTSITLNTWYHFAVVIRIDNGVATYIAYVNGVQSATVGNGIIPPLVARGTTYIGRSATSTDAYIGMRLDAFRIYDYALTNATINRLYISTNSIVPSLVPAQTVGDPTQSSPVYRLNFDSPPPASSQLHGTSYNYVSELDGKLGVAGFDGDKDYVNLAWHADTDGKLFPQTIGGEMSASAWVRYNTLGSWSRIFELAGIYLEFNNNIIFGITASDPTLTLQSYQGSLASTVRVGNSINRYQWVHAVFTIKQRLSDPGAADAALLSLYVNGILIGTATGYLPSVTYRPTTYLAKSAFLADAYFEGYMNTFNFYQYPLSSEAVKAHSCSDKAPLYELVFDVNPATRTGATSYTWLETMADILPTSQIVNHNGLLVLSPSLSQWANPTIASGTNAIGTILPTIGGGGQSTGTQKGWTFEISFKARTLASGMMLFDFADSSFAKRIYLSCSQSTLTFSSSSNTDSTATIPDTSITTDRWIHVAVVLQPDTIMTGSLTAYINGVLVTTLTQFDYPVAVARPNSGIGASSRSTPTGFFDGYIDFLRIYDYAVDSASIRRLHQAFHLGQNATTISKSTYTSGPTNSWSFTNRPTGAQVTSATDFTWLAQSDDRVGVAQFNGNGQRIALRQFEDDSSMPLASTVGPALGTSADGMAFEISFKYTGLAASTVLFDLGSGGGSQSIKLTIVSNDILKFDVHQMDIIPPPIFTLQSPIRISPGWNHVVINMVITTAGQASYRLFLNNALVITGSGVAIPSVARDSCLLGRADWTGLTSFAGQIDNFAWYDHYLSEQTISIHYALAGNPTGVDMDFSIDPRPAANLTATTAQYGWIASDPADVTSGLNIYHPGMLVVQKSLNQYVNFLAGSGPTSVGSVLNTIGYRGSGVNSSLGYTFEWVVKIDSFASNAKILYLSSPDVRDQVTLGFDGNSHDIVFTVRNSQTLSSNRMTVLWGAEASKWYYIAVTIKVIDFDAGTGSWTSYVNGGESNSMPFATLIPTGGYSKAYFGYSDDTTTPFFDAKLDSFRYYPLVLPASKISSVANVYALNTGAPPRPSGGSSGLSGGAIAGIVIGCFAALILLILVCIFMRSRSSKSYSYQKDAHTTADSSDVEMGEVDDTSS